MSITFKIFEIIGIFLFWVITAPIVIIISPFIWAFILFLGATYENQYSLKGDKSK